VQLLRLAAVVLFVLAALGSFGWPVQWGFGTTLGVIALGLAWLAASLIDLPAPPSR
jgi:hypothetical protein